MAKDSLRQDGWGGGNALQRDFEIFMGIALQRDLGFFRISAVISYGFTAETVVRNESRCKASAYLNKKKIPLHKSQGGLCTTLYCAAEFSTSNCYHITFHVMIADKITYLSVFLFLDAASAAAAPARPRAARSRSVLSPVLGALLLFTAATLAIADFRSFF